MVLNNFPNSVPLFVTVTSSVPLFVVESVELQFPGDFVESPEFACMRGELPAFSELFCGSDVVVDFPNPPPNSLPVLSLCQTETVASAPFVFPNTALAGGVVDAGVGLALDAVALETDAVCLADLENFVIPFNIHLGDKRLDARCVRLILSHLNHCRHTATGISPPAELLSTFATTQAAWRFLNNSNVPHSALIKPIREFAQSQIDTLPKSETGNDFILEVIDWSNSDYRTHLSKKRCCSVES
jgi:hypothetical protein